MNLEHERSPLLEELDEARRRIWEECDENEDRYFAMLLDEQEKLRHEGWKFISLHDGQDSNRSLSDPVMTPHVL